MPPTAVRNNMDALVHLKPLSITTALLANLSVTNGKLADDAVTNVKVAAGAAIAYAKLALNDSITVADIATAAKATIATGGTLILRDGSGRAQVAAPVAAGDIVNKAYLDGFVLGFDTKNSVRMATTGNLAATRAANVLTADANGALIVDGVTAVVGNRVMVKNQTTGADNGIYDVTAVGDGSNPFVLTRSADANTSAFVTSGLFAFVSEGTANATTGWVINTPDPITLNTTALNFTQFSSAGVVIDGAGLSYSGSTLNINVDNTTIEINSDALRIKAGGITNSHINAAAAIDWSKISKTGSSLADLTTRAAADLTVAAISNLTATTAQAAFAEIQGNVDELYTKSGIVEGAANTYSSTNYVANSDSLKVAIGKLDAAVATGSSKVWRSSFIDNATGGETTLAKPGGAPDIPDNDADTMLFIDGRKVRRSDGVTDRVFEVDANGDGVTFAALYAGQDVELRYYA